MEYTIRKGVRFFLLREHEVPAASEVIDAAGRCKAEAAKSLMLEVRAKEARHFTGGDLVACPRSKPKEPSFYVVMSAAYFVFKKNGHVECYLASDVEVSQ